MVAFSILIVVFFIGFITLVIDTSGMQAKKEEQDILQREYIRKRMEEDDDLLE